MFRFKQFSVDQSGCAMKINTDGVLLGAMTDTGDPGIILDIGTGTGVIALMLAQRYADAQIDAVEIDEDAAHTAERNFNNSPFADRLKVFPLDFECYFKQFPESKYDLIVSNPPFYVDAVKSPGIKTNLAKHTDIDFFEKLIDALSSHLTPSGVFWLIVPVNTGELIISFAQKKELYPKQIIFIKSYSHSDPHRAILCFSFNHDLQGITTFTIYKSKDIYTEEYARFLEPYFLAF